MMLTDKEKSAKKAKKRSSSCDDCFYYDSDELTGDYSCQMNLDEDEMERFIRRDSSGCPYYKFYDEYKSVLKQN